MSATRQYEPIDFTGEESFIASSISQTERFIMNMMVVLDNNQLMGLFMQQIKLNNYAAILWLLKLKQSEIGFQFSCAEGEQRGQYENLIKNLENLEAILLHEASERKWQVDRELEEIPVDKCKELRAGMLIKAEQKFIALLLKSQRELDDIELSATL
jgi:hypothetical protein